MQTKHHEHCPKVAKTRDDHNPRGIPALELVEDIGGTLRLHPPKITCCPSGSSSCRRTWNGSRKHYTMEPAATKPPKRESLDTLSVEKLCT